MACFTTSSIVARFACRAVDLVSVNAFGGWIAAAGTTPHAEPQKMALGGASLRRGRADSIDPCTSGFVHAMEMEEFGAWMIGDACVPVAHAAAMLADILRDVRDDLFAADHAHDPLGQRRRPVQAAAGRNACVEIFDGAG